MIRDVSQAGFGQPFLLRHVTKATAAIANPDLPSLLVTTRRTVYRCHILDHEDLGMMAVIEIRA